MRDPHFPLVYSMFYVLNSLLLYFCLFPIDSIKNLYSMFNSDYMPVFLFIEASGLFSGKSILQFMYDPPKEALETRTERLELIFQVNRNVKQNMVLLFIYSER